MQTTRLPFEIILDLLEYFINFDPITFFRLTLLSKQTHDLALYYRKSLLDKIQSLPPPPLPPNHPLEHQYLHPFLVFTSQQIVRGARTNSLERVHFGIRWGGDIHFRSDLATKWAAWHYHRPILKFLLEKGGDPMVDSDLPLRNACKAGDVEMVKEVIRRGAHVDSLEGAALRLAVVSETKLLDTRYELVKILLDAGADPDTRDGEALRLACANATGYRIVELLLKYGANPHLRENEAIQQARRLGRRKIVELLLEYAREEV